jgi:glycogen debranching enzyme
VSRDFFENNDLLGNLAKAMAEYERQFGHSVPAYLIRSRLLAAGVEAQQWLDRGEPNPNWKAHHEWLMQQPPGSVFF